MGSQQSNQGKGTELHLQAEQLALEDWCSRVGGARALCDGWQYGAVGFMTNQLANSLIARCVQRAEQARKSPMAHGAMWDLLKGKKAIAQVALESLLFVLADLEGDVPRNRLAAQLGKRAEFVLWLNHPSWGQSAHLKGLRLANGNDLSMGIMRRRLLDKGFRKAAHYVPLSAVERVGLGTLFIEVIAEVTGLIQCRIAANGRGRKAWMVSYTESYWSFLKNWKHNLQLYRPAYMPMCVEPTPWTSLTDGGYKSLTTTCSSVSWERWNHITKTMNEAVLGSVNYLQEQAMAFDHDQVALQRKVWELGISIGDLPARDRLAKPSNQKVEGKTPSDYWKAMWEWRADKRKNTARTKFVHMLMAYERVKNFEKLHWVWYSDYRGRKYQRGAQLSYIGGDVFRSQLCFAKGGRIKGNEDEFMWAMADAYGGVDKRWCAVEEWYHQNSTIITTSGEQPVDFSAYWEAAKSPWRFIQLCREWAHFKQDADHTTGLVFQLDQSCSGYGHAACLINDGALAQFTNVTGEKYVDLYGVVANTAQLMLDTTEPEDEKDRRILCWWHDNWPSRSLFKKCVMPVIYRRSHLTMIDIISLYLRDEVKDFLIEKDLRVVDLAIRLAKLIQLSVDAVLPGIDALHKWLGAVAKVQMDAGYRPHWYTPNGLLVESFSSESDTEKFFLEMSGRTVKVNIKDNEKRGVNKKKSLSQLSADFIHSQDACFLERFVWHWSNYQHPIVTVHDCMGTTIDKVKMMRSELLDQFHRFYSEDHLANHHMWTERRLGVRLPAPPDVGTLDRSLIGQNPFLFT